MARTCGKCRYFSEVDGDFTGLEFSRGDPDFGWCRAPLPMVVDDQGNQETSRKAAAESCPTFKRIKENS